MNQVLGENGEIGQEGSPEPPLNRLFSAMRSAGHLQPSALDYRLESINSFHNRTPRGGQAEDQQGWSEQQPQQISSWSQPNSGLQQMQHMQSSAMTGPSLPQGFSDAVHAARQQGMQDLPPIFSPHLFAFNSAPQGHHMIVSNGASLPEPAQRAHQLPTDSSRKDNPPVCEDTATARMSAIGSLEPALGVSTAPSGSQKSASMPPSRNVDVVVKMALTSGAQAPSMPSSPAVNSRGRQLEKLSAGEASALRHVSSAESREYHPVGFTATPTGPDATSGPVTRTRRRAASGRPKYKDYFTDDASLSESADVAEEDDEDDDEVDDLLSEISMREGQYGMQSRHSSLESADASFRSAGMEGEDGRSSRRSAAAKKPRTKHLLCEQDPEAPGLTMEQRRKIRRRINNRASARRVRQKREEDLEKITGLVNRLDEERNKLMTRASHFQNNCMQLAAQLKDTRDRWQSTCVSNANLQRELMSLRDQVSDWQKGGRPQGVNAQQHARNLQQQASAGAPGPGTPRATGPSIHSNRGDLVQGNSFDLGSFLAH